MFVKPSFHFKKVFGIFSVHMEFWIELTHLTHFRQFKRRDLFHGPHRHHRDGMRSASRLRSAVVITKKTPESQTAFRYSFLLFLFLFHYHFILWDALFYKPHALCPDWAHCIPALSQYPNARAFPAPNVNPLHLKPDALQKNDAAYAV